MPLDVAIEGNEGAVGVIDDFDFAAVFCEEDSEAAGERLCVAGELWDERKDFG